MAEAADDPRSLASRRAFYLSLLEYVNSTGQGTHIEIILMDAIRQYADVAGCVLLIFVSNSKNRVLLDGQAVDAQLFLMIFEFAAARGMFFFV